MKKDAFSILGYFIVTLGFSFAVYNGFVGDFITAFLLLILSFITLLKIGKK